MTRRGWFVLAAVSLLTVVGCGGGGGGGFQMPGQKYKTATLKDEQTVEVNNDTEAWAFTLEGHPTGDKVDISISSPQPVGVAMSSAASFEKLYEGLKTGTVPSAPMICFEKGKKEFTQSIGRSPDSPLKVMVRITPEGGPTSVKITVKRK